MDSRALTLREEKRTHQIEARPSGEYTTATIFGPCLVCEQETEYDAHKHLPYIPGVKWRSGGNGRARGSARRLWHRIDDEWLQKQFQPKRRAQLLETLRAGRELNGNTPMPEAIEVIVCPACREKYRKLREANYRRSQLEQKNREERSKQEDERREYHTSWRRFTLEEVDRTKRSMQFRAILPNFRLYEIAFRWRATSGEGRGDSPPNVVGMWVDGKLVAITSAGT